MENREAMAAGATLFREVQRFRQLWLWVVVIGGWVVVALALGPIFYRFLVDGAPAGGRSLDTPSLVAGTFAVLLVVLISVLLAGARLVTEVTREELRVRFVPFHRRPRTFALDEIESAEARDYRPLLEYGGWGIRLGPKGWAYNVSGNRGVQLVLRSGKRILIGSQRANELARAIAAARRRG